MTSTAATADPVVGVYERQPDAESALKALARAGFDARKLSLVGKVAPGDSQALGFHTTREGLRAWGAAGGFWGAVWNLMDGAAVFVQPPIGLMAAAGPIGAALLLAFEGARVDGGASALSGALASGGVAPRRAVDLEADMIAGCFLLIVHGTEDDVARARGLLVSASASGPLPFHQAA